jgi:3-oxoacyl-[acyl-carrier protein] reductase
MAIDYGLAGKSAFVMGGSRGIGLGISRGLAAAGCRVAIAGRIQADLDAIVDEIRGQGGEAMSVQADLTDIDNFDAVIAAALQAYGPIEIGIFNPRPPKAGAFLDLTEADYEESFRSLVSGFIRVSKLLLPGMREKGWGRIVTIGSGTAKAPSRGQNGYSYALPNTIRLAAVSVTKAMAFEVGKFGITVNTIGTGPIKTEGSDEFMAARSRENGMSVAEMRAITSARTPVGRQGTVEEISSLAVYLCSRQAGFTTGETILCDGGIINCIA